MSEYKNKRIYWIIRKYRKTIKEIIKLYDEYNSKYYDETTEEFIEPMSDEQYTLWKKWHDLVEKIVKGYMDYQLCSENVALRYVCKTIRLTKKRMIKKQKALNLSLKQ